ncbi:MAG: [NiFe]-hydrogenase assembly chaperone HybE [Burkholderiaceae bacterium]|nr:[NiFe]-hydrogenase assembly chaperone HybE [Burkholderiaceae bacterium]
MLAPRVQALEATFRHIAATRMAGLPLVHPRLAVQAVDFGIEPDSDGHPAAPGRIATGVLVTPWFMNLVRLPLQATAAAALPAPGQAAEHSFNGWSFQFLGHEEAGLGRFAAASLVSPMSEFADQPAAVATARALLERLRPRPARRGFLFGAGRAAAG